MNPMKILIKLTTLVAMFVLSAGLGSVFGFDPVASGTVLTSFGTLAQTMLSGQFAVTGGVDVTDLVNEYGAYYNNGAGAAERRKRLKSMLYDATGDFDLEFTTVETENTREEWGYDEHSEVLQPYQPAWTEKGSLAFHPNPASLFWAKYDIESVPDYLVNTWASFLRSNNLSVDECPFIQYLLEKHIIPRGQQDWKTQVAFFGEYVTPTPGTASPAEETADGMLQKLIGYNSDGSYNPFTMGSVPTDPVLFVEFMEDMTFQIPKKYRDRPMTWRMSDTWARIYSKGFAELYNKFYSRDMRGEKLESMYIHDKTNIKVKGYTEMDSSDTFFITSKDNSLLMGKGSAKRDMLKVETLKRQVFLFTDFHKGYHIINPTEMWGNEQGL